MSMILSALKLSEILMLLAAILAVVYEKKLIVFEDKVFAAIARLLKKHARKKEASR